LQKKGRKLYIWSLFFSRLCANFLLSFFLFFFFSVVCDGFEHAQEVVGLHERVRIDDRNGRLPTNVKDCLGDVLNYQLTLQGIMPRR
jgi:hypothetical protein